MTSNDVLNGWAEIANVLGCSVRTAQRRTKAGWIAVYKHPGKQRSRVYAFRTEVEAWKARHAILWGDAPDRPSLPPELPSAGVLSNEHLWGWKAIAQSMGMSVRSVQRWERKAKLPIHRLKLRRRALPYALKAELTAWIAEKSPGRRMASDTGRERFPALLQHFFEASTAHIAVLNRTGTIVFVNAAWRVFGAKNGFREPGFGVGSNYFDICGVAIGAGAETAELVVKGLADLLAGNRRDFKIKYRCDSPAKQRTFLLSAIRFSAGTSPYLVLVHTDVTQVL
jgi:hypothetical protein